MMGFYYLSLSVHSFLLIKQFDQESEIVLKYENDHDGEYEYKSNILFSAERALYQTQKARVFICFRNQHDLTKLKSFSGQIFRDSCEQIQNFKFDYSNLSEVSESRSKLSDYNVFRVNNDVIRFYLGNNNISLKIKGIIVNDPVQDIKIMIVNDNHKGTTIPILFLLKAFTNLVIVLVIYIILIVINKVTKNKLCHS